MKTQLTKPRRISAQPILGSTVDAAPATPLVEPAVRPTRTPPPVREPNPDPAPRRSPPPEPLPIEEPGRRQLPCHPCLPGIDVDDCMPSTRLTFPDKWV